MQKMTPRPEQEEAIQAVVADKSHLCKAEVGAGKSLVGVEAVLRSGVQTCLVIAPLNTLKGWRDTFAVQSDNSVKFRQITSKREGQDAHSDLLSGVPGVYFIGWEYFRRFSWHNAPIDFVICDEIHRATGRRTATFSMLKTTIGADYKLGLSGTVSGNRLEGLWAPTYWLWPNVIDKSYWRWCTKWFLEKLDPYAGKVVVGERNPGSLWASLPSKSSFDSPYQDKPIVHVIEVELAPAQRKLYDRFERDAVAWLDENPLIADLPPIKTLRLRQIALAVPSIRHIEKIVDDMPEMKEEVYFSDTAKSSKADAVVEVLSDLYADGPVPVIVYTHSAKFATMLTLQLQGKGYNARRFIGGMTPQERSWKLENFGKEFDILVCTIATVGEGTNGLQDVCNIEFWLSLEDNRLLNTQAMGRLSRPGQKKTVQRFLFLAKDTLETRQLGRLEADQAQLDESFGGSNGIL